MTASQPSTPPLIASSWERSPSTRSQPSSRSGSPFSGLRTSAATLSPRSLSSRATCPPMKPVAPVTNTRTAAAYRAYTSLRMQSYGDGIQNPRARQRALCIAAAPEAPDLGELRELLRTAGVAVAGELTQRRPAPDPDRYFGKGKLAELKRAIAAADANLVACDDELLPRQERNLEEALGVPVIDRTAIILDISAGYTNAGKSTLLNALTGADTEVRERLFHTLDPTTRTFEVGGRTYLLTDTVGFIRKLPHQLVDAFSATLEEAMGADLIVHVADASVPEDQLVEMLAAVDDVLAEIDAAERPRLLALNKVDLLDEERRRELRYRYPRAAQISGETGQGLDELRDAIEARFLSSLEPVDLLVPYEEGGRLSELHELAGDLERQDTPDGVRVRARVPAAAASRFERFAANGQRPRG